MSYHVSGSFSRRFFEQRAYMHTQGEQLALNCIERSLLNYWYHCLNLDSNRRHHYKEYAKSTSSPAKFERKSIKTGFKRCI